MACSRERQSFLSKYCELLHGESKDKKMEGAVGIALNHELACLAINGHLLH